MTTKFQLYLDAYGRHARLGPGLFALIPVSIAIAVLGLRNLAPISITASILLSAGGPALLADIVRDRGIAAQEKLYQSWGGMFTTQFLRLRQPNMNTARRTKWRVAVQQLTGHALPSAKSEARSPELADQKIESAVDDLRDMLRDKSKFPLLHHELRTYGYRRNMLGIRWWALSVTVLCALLTTVIFAESSVLSPKVAGGSLVVDAALALFWLLVVNASWVKTSAERYAFQLFQAATSLARTSQVADAKVPQTDPVV